MNNRCGQCGTYGQYNSREHFVADDWLRANKLSEELAACQKDLNRLKALFGDYDFHPTVEQCEEIWRGLRKDTINEKEKVENIVRILTNQSYDVFTRFDLVLKFLGIKEPIDGKID